MATAFYTVRVENNYGDGFEYEYEFDTEDSGGEAFDPDNEMIHKSIYEDVMNNIYVDLDFDRLED